MTNVIPADLARTLSDRYDLQSVIGRGGMATVYGAHDRKHQRDVAIKVLRPEIATSIGADRFLKEIQIIARLVHPHILALHDSGEADGFVYYVMPLIGGGSLRDVMQREGRMSVDRATAIVEPIADAIEYAHQTGVLHRDIKPENVLFARAHPIVADFGIAKAVSSANSGAQLTRTGISLGTPGYMSPEQAAGFGDTDARTDVYSLAVLAYEMLVGEIPGRWVLEDSTRAGRFLDAPPTHRRHLDAAGPVVEAALTRALAIRPDQRTESASAFVDDLRGRRQPPRRKFRHDEVEAIVNRAAELELSNPTNSGSMTIGGVEQIGRDVGIDPALVRSAAKELGARKSLALAPPPRPMKRNVLIGGPTRLYFERVIDGELDERDFAPMLDEIRRLTGELGQVSQLGRSFSWTLKHGTSGTRNMEIAITVRGGRTRIVGHENLNNLIGAIFGGVGGGLGGGGLGPIAGGVMSSVKDPWILLFTIPAWLTTVFAIARTSYHYASKHRSDKMEDLVERLADAAQSLIDEREKPRLRPRVSPV